MRMMLSQTCSKKGLAQAMLSAEVVVEIHRILPIKAVPTQMLDWMPPDAVSRTSSPQGLDRRSMGRGRGRSCWRMGSSYDAQNTSGLQQWRLRVSVADNYKILSRNCRGLGSSRAVQSLVDVVRPINPQVLGLIEAKLEFA